MLNEVLSWARAAGAGGGAFCEARMALHSFPKMVWRPGLYISYISQSLNAGCTGQDDALQRRKLLQLADVRDCV